MSLDAAWYASGNGCEMMRCDAVARRWRSGALAKKEVAAEGVYTTCAAAR